MKDIREILRDVFPGGDIIFISEEISGHFVVYMPGQGYWFGWDTTGRDSNGSRVCVMMPMTAGSGEHISHYSDLLAQNRRYRRSGELIASIRERLVNYGTRDSWSRLLEQILEVLQ
jgi:hypothetical protein